MTLATTAALPEKPTKRERQGWNGCGSQKLHQCLFSLDATGIKNALQFTGMASFIKNGKQTKQEQATTLGFIECLRLVDFMECVSAKMSRWQEASGERERERAPFMPFLCP